MRENGKKSVNEIFVEMSTLSVNLFLNGLYFGLFSSFQNVSIQIKIDKSVNGVLGIRNRGDRMEGVDGSTELRRHPLTVNLRQYRVI